ncbi:hypothetical protein GGX14DRAFT_570581 [Mycena pura]|uniref:Zn(2)-C6 fungal-type domain-containing protein n=1 Tax=Mycena pura TaxID=153505 RepID=A0AAD6V8V9_9AGAR|nr:hypothetical protein GGX14DRAFT_570581 [Mycena pura]
MSSANNNASSASGSGRNKGKSRETTSDVARRIELERQQAVLAAQMAALQEEIARLNSGDDKADDGDNDNGGDDEEDDDEREEGTSAGRKRSAPEEGGEKPEEAEPFVPCTACAARSSQCRSIPGQEYAGSSCFRCRDKKVKCSFVPSTDKSRVNRREKERTGKPAGKSGQSTPRISGAGPASISPITGYLRGDPIEDLQTRMTAVEIQLGMRTGLLYRIEESEPPSPTMPPPVLKVERLTSPVLVFVTDDEPSEAMAGPAEGRAGQREPEEGQPGEGAPEDGQPEEGQPAGEQPREEQAAEAMEVDVPGEVEVPIEAQVVVAPAEVPDEVRASPPPEEKEQEPEVKVEPEERWVPRPKEEIRVKSVQGKFKDQDVEYIEIL